MHPTNCLSDDILEALLVGQLKDEEAREYESHLMECAACGERTRNVRATDTLLELLPRVKDVRWTADDEAEARQLVARLSDRSQLLAMTTSMGATFVSTNSDRPGAAEQSASPSGPAAEMLTASSISPGEATAITARPEAGSTASGPTAHTMVLTPVEGAMIDAYRLETKLGEGGMGAVWKAFHTKLKKHVALKVLPAHLLRDAKLVSRFEREMEAVGRLDHPAIVRAMDAGEVQGTHYLVMEYVDGQDLGQLVKSRGARKVPDACEMIRQAAVGLAYAHKNGLVHRDIKPSNLFLTKDGKVKILDLGLARLQGDNLAADPGAGLTGTGQVLGTPDYMAPEQWENTHTVGPACDLYALGCTLFFLLTGRAPFGDDRHQTLPKKMMGHVQESPPDLSASRTAMLARAKKLAASTQGAALSSLGAESKDAANQPSFHLLPPPHDIPPELEAIYGRLMAKEPKDRYASAEELAAALLPMIKGKRPATPGEPSAEFAVVPTPATSPPQPPTIAQLAPVPRPAPASSQPPAPPRSKSWLALGGLGAVLLLGVIIITIRHKDGSTTKHEVDDSAEVSITRKGDDAASKWRGWSPDGPKPAIAPFDATQAKRHQEEWARHFNIPVEYTNSLGMKFVLIPPGEFTMGSTPAEIESHLREIDPNDKHWQECLRSEAPQHKVVLAQPIYLGVHEVTQDEYEKVTGRKPSFFAKTGSDPRWVRQVQGLDTAGHPVEGVSWNDTAEFCSLLSRREGLPSSHSGAGASGPEGGAAYRLPTEAEWEFACRAGTTTRFWFGDRDDELSKAGWFVGNAGTRTHSVGELKANPFGLFDVHGNVWEWVQDAWMPGTYGQFSKRAAIDPKIGFSSDAQRVIRGGGWGSTASYCRSSSRFAFAETARDHYFAFRVALRVDAVQQALKRQHPEIAKGSTSPASSAGWHGWPSDAPKPAIAPFDAAQAKRHQEEWAKYLNVPVDYTNSIGMKFRLIPPGEYLRGSTQEEINDAGGGEGSGDGYWSLATRSQGPRHKVILTRPIYAGIHEVTQRQFERILRQNTSQFSPKSNIKGVAGQDTGDWPVENLTWTDAAEFCDVLSELQTLKPPYRIRAGGTSPPEEGGYRLLTEAEWEFVCRAGTTTRFWTGDSEQLVEEVAWLRGNSEGHTHPVGGLRANPFGLYDLHGNVAEYVQDYFSFDAYSEFRDRPAVNPQGPSKGPHHTMRGGTWSSAPGGTRSALRWDSTQAGGGFIGFRVGLPVEAVRQALKVEGPAIPKVTSTSESPVD